MVLGNNPASTSKLQLSSASWTLPQDGPIPPSYIRTLLPPTGAAVTYGLTLYAAQIAGRACHVSCSTFGWSSLLGCLAVTCSSLAAGQVSFALQRYLAHGPGRLEDFIIPKDQAVFSAVTGLVAFKVLGGRFQNLMPSDLRKRGALANFSVPARGSSYATRSQLRQITEAFQRDGCHHCGRRTGQGIADHIPPNMVARAFKQQSNQFSLRYLFSSPRPTVQRFYPQCINCMKKQSGALLNTKGPLVFHFKRGLPQPPFFAGYLVGALNLGGSVSDSSSWSNKKRSLQRKNWNWDWGSNE